MPIRPYRPEDASAVAQLSAACARSEADFVLNPLWETEQELHAEFARHDIAPEQHLLVAEGVSREVLGVSGFLRFDGACNGDGTQADQSSNCTKKGRACGN